MTEVNPLAASAESAPADTYERNLIEFGGIELQTTPGDFRARAKCKDYAQAFTADSSSMQSNVAALAICLTCPFQNPCLAMAMRDKDKSNMVWGGVTRKTRTATADLIKKGQIDEAWEKVIAHRESGRTKVARAFVRAGREVRELQAKKMLKAEGLNLTHQAVANYRWKVAEPSYSEKLTYLIKRQIELNLVEQARADAKATDTDLPA